MNVPISEFNIEGLDVGSGSRNLNYLYGLSDFFSYVFEDTETVNVMLEANALESSEIYSKFLQLTSAFTLSDIQTHVGATLKLILVKSSDQEGVDPKFKVDLPITKAKYLANRPFLPTEFLENGVDFIVTQIDEKSCYIQLARPIAEYKFSKRPTTNGATEYAIWAVDCIIDEQLVYKHYGKILGINPEVSSEQFSNFIYGLYYLYLNGPTLQVLEQGLNLVLGIPLVRSSGSVLDIRYNTELGQYIIVTEEDQYLLPVGITPIVNVGDELILGTQLAKWIELKDYISSGKWWLSTSIPESVIRGVNSGQYDRFAKEGSNFDYLMTNFLYKNTFLVQINVGSFQYNKYFPYLQDILYNAKPAHAQPVYVWKADIGNDVLSISETEFTVTQAEGSIFGTGTLINGFTINSSVI